MLCRVEYCRLCCCVLSGVLLCCVVLNCLRVVMMCVRVLLCCVAVCHLGLCWSCVAFSWCVLWLWLLLCCVALGPVGGLLC